MPWQLAIETGSADEAGFDLHWCEYSTGTGAMIADLVDKKLDLAMLLTEGAALGLARGLPIEAISLYTFSPLIWGVHVPPDSPLRSLDELAGRRFAISRHGSGSHLMSLAMAAERGWPVAALDFVIVDNLPGAVEAFARRRADVFLWEHFTTEPTVAAGLFRRIDDFVAPWPAWVVCARAGVLETAREGILQLLDLVFGQAQGLAAAADASERIGARYDLQPDAVAAWLGRTRWVNVVTDPSNALGQANRMLQSAGAV